MNQTHSVGMGRYRTVIHGAGMAVQLCVGLYLCL